MKGMLTVLLITVCAALGAQQPSPRDTKKAIKQTKPAPPPSWWLNLLRFAGVTATPSSQREIGNEPLKGDVLIRDLERSSAIRLFAGKYHSPIFGCQDAKAYALSGQILYEVNTRGGEPKRVLEDDRLRKLVGIDPHACNDVLVVTQSSLPGLLSLTTHDLVELKIEDVDLWYVRYLLGDERNYGDLSVNSERKTAADVLNVVLKNTSTNPGQVTHVTSCKNGCVQPSLSHSRDFLVYVRLP